MHWWANAPVGGVVGVVEGQVPGGHDQIGSDPVGLGDDALEVGHAVGARVALRWGSDSWRTRKTTGRRYRPGMRTLDALGR